MTTVRRVVSTNYILDITTEKLSSIMDKDCEADHPLYMLLAKIDGIHDVDYNGHFGPHIYVTLESEYEGGDVWRTVYETIENYL